MPLIYNSQSNKNVLNTDNLAKKRIVKALQQQTTSSIPQTDPDLEDNADKYFDKIFELSNSIETYLFELGVFVSSEDTSKVDVLGEQSTKKSKEEAKERAKIEKEIAGGEAKLIKLQKEIEREEKKKKPDDVRRANLEEQYFEVQEIIAQLKKKLQTKIQPPPVAPLSLEEDFGGEEEDMPELEGMARQVIKGKKLVFKEEQSIPIVAKLLNLFKTYKKVWKELVPFSAGLSINQLTDLGVMVDTISKALNSFIEDTKVEIPKNKQRVYEQLFTAVDEISTIIEEVSVIYQNIYYYYSQTSSPAPPQQSVGTTTGSGFAVRPYYSRTRYL